MENIHYQVLVGNTGSVYSGENKENSLKTFEEYKKVVSNNKSSLFLEPVMWFETRDDEDTDTKHYLPQKDKYYTLLGYLSLIRGKEINVFNREGSKSAFKAQVTLSDDGLYVVVAMVNYNVATKIHLDIEDIPDVDTFLLQLKTKIRHKFLVTDPKDLLLEQ